MMCVHTFNLQEISPLEVRRLQNIERNNKELQRLGLKSPPSYQAVKASVKLNDTNQGSSGQHLLTTSIGKYTYQITTVDLQREQQAFRTGEGVSSCIRICIVAIISIICITQKKELVEGFGVYIKYVDVEQCEQTSKNSPTGLMKALMSIWYSREQLAPCSAKSGINDTIRTAVFSKLSTNHMCIVI